MNQSEVYERLKKFYSASNEQVSEYAGLVEVQVFDHNEGTKITKEEIHAVLNYQVDLQSIRQIDPWTIVITF